MSTILFFNDTAYDLAVAKLTDPARQSSERIEAIVDEYHSRLVASLEEQVGPEHTLLLDLDPSQWSEYCTLWDHAEDITTGSEAFVGWESMIQKAHDSIDFDAVLAATEIGKDQETVETHRVKVAVIGGRDSDWVGQWIAQAREDGVLGDITVTDAAPDVLACWGSDAVVLVGDTLYGLLYDVAPWVQDEDDMEDDFVRAREQGASEWGS